jgi:uncharacterized iron-regulated membrane protein
MKLLRAFVFWVHLAVGCAAGLVIAAMASSGILLAFERQITAWADAPVVLQGPADSSLKLALDSVLRILENDGHGIPTQLVVHSRLKAPVEARFGRERTLFLNPWTAEIVGQPSETARTFFGTVERFHRSLGLGMQSAFGRGITGAANLAVLFMLLSGIYLWVPKLLNVQSLRNRLLFRGGLMGRAREWNWHNVIGMWTAVPLFFIVLTGVIISYPWASNLLYKLTGTQPPAGGWRGERDRAGIGPRREATGTASPAESVQYRSLDDLVLVATGQIAGWKSITIDVPDSQDRVLNVSIDKSIGGQPEQTSQLVIDRQSGHLEAIRRFSENNAGRKLRAWARFLHTGEEFGVAGETIAAIACLGAVVLVWTGLSMAVRRALAAITRSRGQKRATDRADKELQTV